MADLIERRASADDAERIEARSRCHPCCVVCAWVTRRTPPSPWWETRPTMSRPPRGRGSARSDFGAGDGPTPIWRAPPRFSMDPADMLAHLERALAAWCPPTAERREPTRAPDARRPRLALASRVARLSRQLRPCAQGRDQPRVPSTKLATKPRHHRTQQLPMSWHVLAWPAKRAACRAGRPWRFGADDEARRSRLEEDRMSRATRMTGLFVAAVGAASVMGAMGAGCDDNNCTNGLRRGGRPDRNRRQRRSGGLGSGGRGGVGGQAGIGGAPGGTGRRKWWREWSWWKGGRRGGPCRHRGRCGSGRHGGSSGRHGGRWRRGRRGGGRPHRRAGRRA